MNLQSIITWICSSFQLHFAAHYLSVWTTFFCFASLSLLLPLLFSVAAVFSQKLLKPTALKLLGTDWQKDAVSSQLVNAVGHLAKNNHNYLPQEFVETEKKTKKNLHKMKPFLIYFCWQFLDNGWITIG